MHTGFCCELFFGTVFGLILRTASWLNLYLLMTVLKVVKKPKQNKTKCLNFWTESRLFPRSSMAGFMAGNG